MPDSAQAHIEGNIDKLAEVLLDYDCASNGLSFTAQKNVLDITSKGISAHASQPFMGQNAFFPLLELLDKALPGRRRRTHSSNA